MGITIRTFGNLECPKLCVLGHCRCVWNLREIQILNNPQLPVLVDSTYDPL